MKALESFYKKAVESCPELDVRWCEGLPPSADAGSVLFVPGHRDIEDFDGKLSGYPAGITVICSQELCHQVSAVYRYR